MSEADLIRSECGKYFTERHMPFGQWRSLYDDSGNVIVRTTFWSNCSTSSRTGFECGSGDTTAKFSYPRYPKWFKRRWVSCFDVWIDELSEIVKKHGGAVLTASKTDMNCYSHIGFRATAEQTKKIDAEIASKTDDWNGPPMKRSRGQWNIECPSEVKS